MSWVRTIIVGKVNLLRRRDDDDDEDDDKENDAHECYNKDKDECGDEDTFVKQVHHVIRSSSNLLLPFALEYWYLNWLNSLFVFVNSFWLCLVWKIMFSVLSVFCGQDSELHRKVWRANYKAAWKILFRVWKEYQCMSRVFLDTFPSRNMEAMHLLASPPQIVKEKQKYNFDMVWSAMIMFTKQHLLTYVHSIYVYKTCLFIYLSSLAITYYFFCTYYSWIYIFIFQHRSEPPRTGGLNLRGCLVAPLTGSRLSIDRNWGKTPLNKERKWREAMSKADDSKGHGRFSPWFLV